MRGDSRCRSPSCWRCALPMAGIARNSWTAGGADQYAYVSQADLWLNGDLTVPIPLAATAPWPEAVAHIHAARVSTRRVQALPSSPSRRQGSRC